MKERKTLKIELALLGQETTSHLDVRRTMFLAVFFGYFEKIIFCPCVHPDWVVNRHQLSIQK